MAVKKLVRDWKNLLGNKWGFRLYVLKSYKMKEIKIVIEKAKDGFFGAYAENTPGIYGGGDTVQSVKSDILNAIDTLKEEGLFPYADGGYRLTYRFDIESLLENYKGVLTNAGIERLTGINQRQIYQYATGMKKPRKEQRKKIEAGLHKLGQELLAIEL